MIFFLLHISTYEGYAALAFLLNRLRSAVKSNILFFKYWLTILQLPAWRGYWTGLRDAGHEGTWLWQDGTPYNKSYV